MKLVIVESPTKCHTIKKFLGKDYDVVASNGHIRDLATSGKGGLGVDIENKFTPTYVINADKKKKVNELVKLAKSADEVILATDPDREGEAISWHLAEVLKLDIKNTKRLEFHEITKTAILRAIENPRTIDMNLVSSQETRRIIDRIMGFELSSLLKKKIGSLSAGRVQSCALRIITDREKEIKSFIPEEYWTIQGTFLNDLTAKLSSYLQNDLTIHNEQEADEILNRLPNQFEVVDINVKERKSESKAPYTTSTMQQDSFNIYSYSTKKTALLAQKLYEEGLITYMRTDSIRLAPEFIEKADKFIETNFGKEYLGFVKSKGSKGQVQDAHEAIRPTDLNNTPKLMQDKLDKDFLNLYTMIYNRALASLMKAKVDEVTNVTLSGNGYDFVLEGVRNKFDGYSAVLKSGVKEKTLPKFKLHQMVNLDKVSKEQHFTKPQPRYSEARLVKTMEELGIGRPSTYASTISTLLDRDYVSSSKGVLVPSDQGILTVDMLTTYFSDFVDTKFTAEMEKNLDDVVSGSDSRLALLTSFYSKFEPLYEKAKVDMPKEKAEETGNICPKCGRPLVLRKGKYGEFEACSGYPECKYIVKKEKEVEYVGRKCPKCGSELVTRHSRKGDFVGCSNYPKCDYIEGNEEKEKKEKPKDQLVGRKCPKCGHELVIKKGKYGKGDFIGCSNFPRCRYIEKIEK